jgi:transposase
LLAPASKKRTFENKNSFFENSDFSLDDVYRSLSFFNRHKDALLLKLHNRITALYGRDSSLVYYDVTNYYFELEGQEGFCHRADKKEPKEPDGFRKRGVCKSHSSNPIVQMGLFIDNNGLPITYKLFPGNTNDCMTYRPNLSQIKKDFGLSKTIVVADKGMTTGDNIWYTLSAKDGYVFSMSVRGADKQLKEYVLDQNGYKWQGEDYKRKSRLTPRIIYVTAATGKKMRKTVHEKQVVFYSEKYAKRAKTERLSAIAKAQQMINNPTSYTRATSYGAAAYIKNLDFDKDSGEIIDTGKALMLDLDKIKEQESLDGYYLIVTSEQHENDDRIIEMYRGLWKIEESFRITKSDLDARPIYVSKKEHIESHFLTCFISLLIARILERTTNNKYSIAKILESLQMSECTYLQQNYYLFDFCDNVLNDLGTSLKIDFSKRVRTLDEIKKIFADVKK